MTSRDVSRSRHRSRDRTGDRIGVADRSNSHNFSRDRTGDHNTRDISLGPVTADADVWGLGATLYHATGRPPFATPLPEGERFPQLREAPAPLPDRVAPALRELIDACLDPEPGARPAPAELAADLELLDEALPKRLVLGRFRVRPR